MANGGMIDGGQIFRWNMTARGFTAASAAAHSHGSRRPAGTHR